MECYLMKGKLDLHVENERLHFPNLKPVFDDNEGQSVHYHQKRFLS